jgi:hypothetical protein
VVIFLAIEAASMPERLGVIRETRPHITDGLENFATRVRNYWIVTTVFGFIVAVLDVIALAIIGVALFITSGVLAFVTNYIPTLASFSGVIPPALIALLDCRQRSRRRGRLHGHQRGGSGHRSATGMRSYAVLTQHTSTSVATCVGWRDQP